MEADILDGKIGDVGSYDLEFKGGKLSLTVDAKIGGELVAAGIVIKVGASEVLDAIAKAIPGQIDDAVIGLIKSALLKA